MDRHTALMLRELEPFREYFFQENKPITVFRLVPVFPELPKLGYVLEIGAKWLAHFPTQFDAIKYLITSFHHLLDTGKVKPEVFGLVMSIGITDDED